VREVEVMVPCDQCGQQIAWSEYGAHAAAHATAPSSSHQAVAPGSAVHSATPQQQLSSAVVREVEVMVPCDQCGQQIAWSEYGAHVAAHEAAYRMEDDRLQCSHEPDDIALQVVAMVREQGRGLDGGRDICNFDVVARFVRQMHDFGNVETAAEIVYHWTREENIGSIEQNNLRVAGEKVGTTQIPMAHGAVHGQGIYAATDINYGVTYGRGATQALLCLALPGVILEGNKLPADGPDSLRKGAMRVYRKSSQLLPLFLTDRTSSHQAHQAAKRVAEFMQARYPQVWTFTESTLW